MNTTQNALVAHILAAKAMLGLNTVEAYAGQLAPDSIKMNKKLPACYVMFISGNPVSEERENQFDLLVITESRSFDRKTKQTNNLATVSTLAEWLVHDDNICFIYNGERFWIQNGDPDISARTIVQDNRFTVIALSIAVKRG